MSTHIRIRIRPGAAPTIQESTPAAVGQLPTSEAFEGRLAIKVEYRPINELKASPRNARTHSDAQICKIAASLDKFGFVNPILVDEQDEVIAGHGRLLAARKIGLTQAPTIRLSHMSEADRRAYRIADNRLAELSGWDEEILKAEFVDLFAVDVDLPELTGFDLGDIEPIINKEPEPPKSDPADEASAAEGPAITRVGDVWEFLNGNLLSRVACADAKQAESYECLLAGEKAQMAFCDSPYNVPNVGHVTKRKNVREFADAHGEMSKAEFTSFLKLVMQRQADVSADGAIHFQCMDWAHAHEMLEAGNAVYSDLKNICVWTKQAGMGSLWRSAHELVFCWKVGTAPHINNVQLGKYLRHRSNVWAHASVRSHRNPDLGGHPCPKPVAMVMDAIKDCSRPHGVILDAFGGSGTTLIAAAKTRRRGYLLELDPLYVDVTVRRWQKLFTAEARLAETGETFAEVAARRLAPPKASDGVDDGEADDE